MWRLVGRYDIQTLLWGLATLACVWVILILPPLTAPSGTQFWILLLSMAVPLLAIGTVVVFVLGLVKKRWLTLVFAAIVALAFQSLRVATELEDDLWVSHFVRTADLRKEFLAFMDGQPTKKKDVPLPATLSQLSDNSFAYLTLGNDGKRFYCYSVFTHGIDNSRGFCWSESGQPPDILAFPVIVSVRPLGKGWFLFAST